LVTVAIAIATGLILSLSITNEEKAYGSNSSQVAAGVDSSPYQTYVNETNNFSIQYPSDWIAETKTADPEKFEVVRIFPQELMADQYPNVSLTVAFLPKEVTFIPNLTALSEGTLAQIEMTPEFRLINSSLNENVTVSFANGTEPKTIPAFVTNIYDFSRPFVDSQEMGMAFFINDNLVGTSYDAVQDSFAKYLPQVKKMINSFQVLNKK
jgi:hypothetical protein